MSSYDVVVIGAGPAGCVAAFHLAQAGHRTLVLEQSTLPRHTVCGEFISPEALDAFEEMDVLGEMRSAGGQDVDSVLISGPNGRIVQADMAERGFALSRFALDRMLCDRAASVGAEIRFSERVIDIRGSLEGGFRVQTATGAYQARAVVGTFGKRSILDRKLERGFFSQATPYLGFKQHFDGNACGSSVELHAFEGGYCGLVGIEDGRMNACCLIEKPVLEGGTADSIFDRLASLNPLLSDRLRGRQALLAKPLVISQISFERKDVMEGDVFMAGDAARLITPMCGDGIAMAIEGGRMAAGYASSFLYGRLNAAETCRAYRADWHATFGRRTNIGRVLQRAFLRKTLLSPGLAILARAPGLMQWMIRATRS
jgi:menaquinone-9 beta-reductase